MLPYLHRISAITFYILAGSFFLAYVLMYNGIMPHVMIRWMESGDLPLLLSGLLFGGLSMYRSVRSEKGGSTGAMAVIGLPLLLLFLVVAILNFRLW